MDIGVAGRADLALLPAVETAADEVFRGGPIWPLPAAATAEDLAESAAVLVAGAPPVGFVRLDVVDGEAHVSQLSVVPQASGRGVGSALLAAAYAWAAAAGHRSITLTTFADVPCNAPFYARRGFAVTADLGPELAAIRAAEAELGLDALGVRVAMRRSLVPDPAG
jgi:GNAT superfamily N-acetyltransferase